ncbi:MAG: hypothetical protein ABIK09_08480 [Pseudomonadota bacterium]
MRQLGLLAAAMVLAGCGSGQIGAKGSDASGHDLPGDGLVIQGRVTLGTPVEGATVRALVNGEDGAWQEVSAGLTDDAGIFSLAIPGDRIHRPLRLVADGAAAQYVEAADGAKATLGADGLLMADLESAANREGTVVHVTAWTTLAGCAADAYTLGHQVGGVIGWPEAMLLARLRVRDHLAGDHELGLPATAPSDLSEGPWPYPNPATTLGLAATGLSMIARSGDGPEGTSAELVGWLCRDLSDGLFDGFESNIGGPRHLVPPNGSPNIDADTTRFTLAAATHTFLLGERNLSGVTPDQLAGLGDYYDVVSMDNGPLYPPEPPPTRFDPIPPALTFTADSPEEGAFVSAPIILTVTGTDPYGPVLISFDGTASPGPLAPDDASTPDTRSLAIDPAAFEVQGARTFQFSGADPQSNEASIERSLILDSHAPGISVIDPDQDGCVAAWPDALVLTVTDHESTVASVSSGAGGCTNTVNDLWTCPVPGGAAPVTTLSAADAAGNAATIDVWLCKDKEPPTISFGPFDDVAWWGPKQTTLVVEITDPSGVGEWEATAPDGTMITPSSTQAIADGIALSFALPDDATAFDLTMRATDPNGNEQIDAVALSYDDTPPLFDAGVPASPLGSVSTVTFLVSLSDEQSGVAELVVTSQGIWAVTEELPGELPEGTALYRVSGKPVVDVPPAPTLAVDLVGRDAVGNEGGHVVVVQMDLTPPVLELAWSEFQDETGCSGSLDDDGDLVYTCPGPWVELSDDTCADGCPPIVKLASRLGYEGPDDVEPNNLPSIGLGIEDTCPLQDPAPCTMTFSWTFFRGAEVLLTGTYNDPITPLPLGDGHLLYGGLVLFSAEGMFGVPAEEADFSEASIPNRLVISATDAGGNTGVLDLDLDITILPPPVLFHWTSHADPTIQAMEDAAPSDLAATLDTLAQALDMVAGDPDVEVGQFVLTNPTTLPVVLEITDVPTHELMWIQQQGYLGTTETFGACLPGTCLYVEGDWDLVNPIGGSCEAPVIWSADIAPTVETAVTADVLDPDGILEWSEEGFLLPPGASVAARIGVSLVPIPALLPVEDMLVSYNGGLVPAQIHFLDVPDQWAICGAGPGSWIRYRTTPALSRVQSSTEAGTDALQIVARNPGAEAAVPTDHPAGWSLVYLNQWPVNLTLPQP